MRWRHVLAVYCVDLFQWKHCSGVLLWIISGQGGGGWIRIRWLCPTPAVVLLFVVLWSSGIHKCDEKE